MKKFKRFAILMILFLCYTFVCAFSYSSAVSSDLANSVFRLHIIANSDSEEDQNLKLKVRDNVLAYMKEISSNVSSKEEIMSIMNDNLDNFYDIARKTIKDNGYNYEVKLNIGNYDFPTKEYHEISLPAGRYDALRIEIGEAKGHNWWCVMFPTLCFVDIDSGSLEANAKEILESNLNEEEYKFISHDNIFVNFKFKIVEFFEDVKISLASR